MADWINQAGDIVGISSLPGDQQTFAFLWKNRVMQNLGSVDGDACSEGLSVNASDQVVGDSWDCGREFQHSFLWENGSMVDLLSLIPPGSGMQLRVADSINDRGEIAVQGILSNGDYRAILLIPCDENHPAVEGCDYSLVEESAAVSQISPAVRGAATALPASLPRQMTRHRFPGLAFGPRN
jgi:probable HAF family extracellular repeat protein